jgi:hypothetical protein
MSRAKLSSLSASGTIWFVRQSGAKATAFQTLTRLLSVFNFAKRLECGAFTAAFVLR